MGVCLSKRSASSPRVDAGGSSAASRPESPRERVLETREALLESFSDAKPLGALARSLSAGQVAAADAAINEEEREPQRRKIDADDSVAMDTGASGSNPPMPREGYVGASPRFRAVFSHVQKLWIYKNGGLRVLPPNKPSQPGTLNSKPETLNPVAH